MPVFPIAQVKKPRRSTTTPTFFDLHTQKNILRNWSGYLSNAILEDRTGSIHKNFRYRLLWDLPAGTFRKGMHNIFYITIE